MSGKPELSIIIPVFNKWQLTLDCLVSLKEYTPGDHYEVIVVDNASKDATITQLEPLGRALFGKRFSAIRNTENINFGPACNQGARAAAAPLLFFLNNDTLLTKNWLPPLLDAMRNEPGLGAVGPLLLYMNDTVQHLGIKFFIRSVGHLYQNYPRTHPAVTKKRDLQGITAAAMMLPKVLFRECGGFYEEYKNGFEDVDLCLQIRERGKKMRCVSESAIYHLESQTPGRNIHEKANAKILTERWWAKVRHDAHIHAMRDGFSPVIDDTLSLSMLLGRRESDELMKEAKHQSFRWIHDKLTENPGWIDGAEMLKSMAESYGDVDTALYYADLKSSQYISYSDTEAMLRLALRARNEEQVEYCKDILLWLRNKFTGSPCNAEIILKKHLRIAHTSGDRSLVKILEDKVAQIQTLSFPAPEDPRRPKF